jgi:hypothetical protein
MAAVPFAAPGNVHIDHYPRTCCSTAHVEPECQSAPGARAARCALAVEARVSRGGRYQRSRGCAHLYSDGGVITRMTSDRSGVTREEECRDRGRGGGR